MLESDKALEIVLSSIKQTNIERISIFDAMGRIIAEPTVSRRNLPACDMSAMDGYAVLASDTENAPTKLSVKGIIPAGLIDQSLTIKSGECYRIMTGAFIPNGANAVIQHELTDNGKTCVTINQTITPNFNIRKKAGDMASGSTIDRVGERVTPYHIARYVSAGVFFISVHRKPRVAVISTGSELADLSEQDSPLKTFDSNGPLIKAMLDECGADASYLGVVPDNEELLIKRFESLKNYDIIVTSGGISMGDFDFMKLSADKLGITWQFDTINQKPGKHMGFGKKNEAIVFACPGNPVSAMFCTYFYIKPTVLKMAGARNYLNTPIITELATSFIKRDKRTCFDRARVEMTNGSMKAYPVKFQDSNRIESIVAGNAFIVINSDKIGEIPAGTKLNTYVFETHN